MSRDSDDWLDRESAAATVRALRLAIECLSGPLGAEPFKDLRWAFFVAMESEEAIRACRIDGLRVDESTYSQLLELFWVGQVLEAKRKWIQQLTPLTKGQQRLEYLRTAFINWCRAGQRTLGGARKPEEADPFSARRLLSTASSLRSGPANDDELVDRLPGKEASAEDWLVQALEDARTAQAMFGLAVEHGAVIYTFHAEQVPDPPEPSLHHLCERRRASSPLARTRAQVRAEIDGELWTRHETQVNARRTSEGEYSGRLARCGRREAEIDRIKIHLVGRRRPHPLPILTPSRRASLRYRKNLARASAGELWAYLDFREDCLDADRRLMGEASDRMAAVTPAGPGWDEVGRITTQSANAASHQYNRARARLKAELRKLDESDEEHR